VVVLIGPGSMMSPRGVTLPFPSTMQAYLHSGQIFVVDGKSIDGHSPVTSVQVPNKGGNKFTGVRFSGLQGL
jgi:hypothetical protein